MSARNVPEKFLVAFSLAAEQRELVCPVVEAVEQQLGASISACLTAEPSRLGCDDAVFSFVNSSTVVRLLGCELEAQHESPLEKETRLQFSERIFPEGAIPANSYKEGLVYFEGGGVMHFKGVAVELLAPGVLPNPVPLSWR